MKPIDTKNRKNIAIGDDVSQGERKRKENVIAGVNAVQKQKKKSKQDITTDQMTIGHLTQGDDVMTNRTVDLAKSKYYPPIVFDWDADSLTQLWNNAVAYAAGGGVVAIPINGGVNLPATVDIDLLRTEILKFVAQGAGNPVPLPGATIIGNTMGLACSRKQVGMCFGLLRGLELHPWFAAVLNVNPIPAPLASIWCPRPHNSTGLFDQISIFCTLWA